MVVRACSPLVSHVASLQDRASLARAAMQATGGTAEDGMPVSMPRGRVGGKSGSARFSQSSSVRPRSAAVSSPRCPDSFGGHWGRRPKKHPCPTRRTRSTAAAQLAPRPSLARAAYDIPAYRSDGSTIPDCRRFDSFHIILMTCGKSLTCWIYPVSFASVLTCLPTSWAA